jgi:TrmH family RNA methyltransferase
MVEFEVVVVDLKYPMNIGSAARTMSCMGFTKLSLVRPCKEWNSMDAVKFSLFGKDILEKAKIYEDLGDLKTKETLLLGFSRRIGKRRSFPVMLTELGDFIQKFGSKKKIKLVFGGESSGLSTEDLNLCDYVVTIDKDIVNNSLSLPSAVVAALYEVRRFKSTARVDKESPSNTNSGETGILLERIRELLMKSGFIDIRDGKRVVPRLGSILKRLSLGEVRLIHSMLKKSKGDGLK